MTGLFPSNPKDVDRSVDAKKQKAALKRLFVVTVLFQRTCGKA
jgi:hypothetical protein